MTVLTIYHYVLEPNEIPFGSISEENLQHDYIFHHTALHTLHSILPFPPSKFYSPIYELILLMSGQCTSPGPPYPCPVCLSPFIKSKYSNYRCWLLGIPKMLRTSKSFTSPRSVTLLHMSYTFPPKGKPLNPLFSSPTLIPLLMGKSVFPSRSPPPLLTGKGDAPLSLLTPAHWWGNHSCLTAPLLHLNLSLSGIPLW